jgi:hypothetical protein
MSFQVQLPPAVVIAQAVEGIEASDAYQNERHSRCASVKYTGLPLSSPPPPPKNNHRYRPCNSSRACLGKIGVTS